MRTSRTIGGMLCLLVATLALSGCYNFKDYKKVYKYKPPQGYVEVPAYVRGGYLQNISGLTNGKVNERMGYAMPVAFDGLTVPRSDTPTALEQYTYSAGGFALGQGIRFHTYTVSPGQHNLTIDVTMLGKTKSYLVPMVLQPGYTYTVKGQGGGLSARVWIEDQNGNLAAIVTRGAEDDPFQLYR